MAAEHVVSGGQGRTMEREIVTTDRKYRRNLFSAYLLAIGVIAAFWRWGIPMLIKYLQHLPNKERIEMYELIGHIFLLLFIPAAVYLIIIGRKVCRYQAMPYPGMRVIHDTAIVRGKRAVFRGRSLIVLGTVMIVSPSSANIPGLVTNEIRRPVSKVFLINMG